MKHLVKFFFLLLILYSCSNIPQETDLNRGSADLKLWYPEPATIWEEALPLGNGRLGAMVLVIRPMSLFSSTKIPYGPEARTAMIIPMHWKHYQ
jgi:hypothetical protein